jgi:hypothetical protein
LRCLRRLREDVRPEGRGVRQYEDERADVDRDARDKRA